MIITIKNGDISVQINTVGGELYSVKKADKEYLWQGDEKYWERRAPLLFPIVGSLRDGKINIGGKLCHLPSHGFLRDTNGEILSQGESEVTLHFSFSDEQLQNHPFKCDFTAYFYIENNKIHTEYTLCNLDSKTMVYNFGLHPAFNCNTQSDEKFEDYYIEFANKMHLQTCLFNDDVEVELNRKKTVVNNENYLNLTRDLFHRTVIFTDINFNKIYLCNKSHGKLLEFSYDNFNIFAMWQPKNAPFVCFEPWAGMSSIVQDFENLEENPTAQFLNAGEQITYKMNLAFFD